MRSAWYAAFLSAALWPGAGQFFNRDVKKGLALTFLTALLGLSLTIGLGKVLVQAEPTDTMYFDLEQMRRDKNAKLAAKPSHYGTYSLLLTLTWVFGVVDAFLGARERQHPAPPPPADAA